MWMCANANANAKRKAKLKKGVNEGEATQEAVQGTEGVEGRQKVERRGMSSYCAVYEVDWLLTLYVEA